jgi:hypothetical protein
MRQWFIAYFMFKEPHPTTRKDERKSN